MRASIDPVTAPNQSVNGTGIRTMSPCRGCIPILIVEWIVPEIDAAGGSSRQIITFPCLGKDENRKPLPSLKRADDLHTAVWASRHFVMESRFGLPAFRWHANLLST